MRIGLNALKKRATGLFVAGILLALSASGETLLAEPLRLGFSRLGACDLVCVASSQGFFKKQGVEVVTKEYEADVFAVNDLIAGKNDIAVGSDLVFVLQSFKHPDLRMLATICRASDQSLVVRKDRGIAGPQDLKGRRVAVVRGSSSEYFLHHYAISNRIPVGSFQVAYATPSEMVKSISKGNIDAALCWPPYTTEMMKELGPNGALWPAQSGQYYYMALFAKQGFLEMQSRVLERFLTALSDAEAFLSKTPEQVWTRLRQRLKLGAESPPSTRYHFSLQLTQDLLLRMESEAIWAIRNHLVKEKEVPNYLEFFHFDALDKAKPEGVGVVH